MFGHTVGLNFNRQDDFHSTYFTSIMTVFIRIAIGIYVFITVKKMVLKESDQNSSSIIPVKIADMGPISYMDSGLKIFNVIEKQGGRPDTGVSNLVLGSPELKNLISIRYKYNVVRNNKISQSMMIPAKDCTA
jgi:hypothetical protein